MRKDTCWRPCVFVDTSRLSEGLRGLLMTNSGFRLLFYRPLIKLFEDEMRNSFRGCN
jgi:hypothetical protein